jgi:hypothetical protein
MALSIVQSAVGSGFSTGATGVGASWPSPTTVGNWLGKFVVFSSNSGTVTQPSGGAYSLFSTSNNTTSNTCYVYCFELVNAGVQSGPQSVQTTNACAFAMVLVELSGVSTTSPRDSSPAVAQGNSSSPAGGTLGTSTATELILTILAQAVVGANATFTYSAPTGGTGAAILKQASGNDGVGTPRATAGICVVDFGVTSTGSYAGGCTSTLSQPYVGVTIGLQGASSTNSVSDSDGARMGEGAAIGFAAIEMAAFAESTALVGVLVGSEMLALGESASTAATFPDREAIAFTDTTTPNAGIPDSEALAFTDSEIPNAATVTAEPLTFAEGNLPGVALADGDLAALGEGVGIGVPDSDGGAVSDRGGMCFQDAESAMVNESALPAATTKDGDTASFTEQGYSLAFGDTEATGTTDTPGQPGDIVPLVDGDAFRFGESEAIGIHDGEPITSGQQAGIGFAASDGFFTTELSGIGFAGYEASTTSAQLGESAILASATASEDAFAFSDADDSVAGVSIVHDTAAIGFGEQGIVGFADTQGVGTGEGNGIGIGDREAIGTVDRGLPAVTIHLVEAIHFAESFVLSDATAASDGTHLGEATGQSIPPTPVFDTDHFRFGESAVVSHAITATDGARFTEGPVTIAVALGSTDGASITEFAALMDSLFASESAGLSDTPPPPGVGYTDTDHFRFGESGIITATAISASDGISFGEGVPLLTAFAFANDGANLLDINVGFTTPTPPKRPAAFWAPTVRRPAFWAPTVRPIAYWSL